LSVCCTATCDAAKDDNTFGRDPSPWWLPTLVLYLTFSICNIHLFDFRENC
jgi:hypothetical protein